MQSQVGPSWPFMGVAGLSPQSGAAGDPERLWDGCRPRGAVQRAKGGGRQQRPVGRRPVNLRWTAANRLLAPLAGTTPRFNESLTRCPDEGVWSASSIQAGGQPDGRGQAAVGGAGVAQRPAARGAASEAACAADLRQRPALLGGLRHAGDPAGAHHRWAGLPVAHTVGGARGGAADDDRGRLLHPCGAGLPQRRRVVRGRLPQPGRLRWAGRRQRAADRLRDDRGGVGGRRRGQHHFRGPRAACVPGRCWRWASSRC